MVGGGFSYERSTIPNSILHLSGKKGSRTPPPYKKGQIHYYVPIVSEAEYIADQTETVLQIFGFGGSAAKMIAAYASDDDNGGISEKER